MKKTYESPLMEIAGICVAEPFSTSGKDIIYDSNEGWGPIIPIT